MSSPSLAPLTYQAFILRRTSANGLRVSHFAVARGPGEVLVPLPWEARLADETPDRAHVWALWDQAVSRWQFQHHIHDGTPTQPRISRDAGATGERGVRLLAREALPAPLVGRLPSTWSFARSFLWWPAAPARRGIAAWFSRAKERELAPVALSVEAASSPFRAQQARFEMTVATAAEFADTYLIDAEQLVTVPASGFSRPDHWTGVALPGLAEPSDHLHWCRDDVRRLDEGEIPHARLTRLQLYRDASSDLEAEMRERKT
ncbi:MAG: hypothetical protein QM820_58215 [Minicystis sp.]